MNNSLELSQAMEILQSHPCGILFLDNTQRISWINTSLEQFLGDHAGDLIGNCIDDITETSIKSLFNNEITPLSDINTQSSIWLQSVKVPAKEGTIYYFIDITEQQKLEYKYSQLQQDQSDGSTRDSVTGLLNDKGLLHELGNQVSRSRRYNNPLSLIRMDIADFEQIANKSQILTSIGHFLNDQLRWADMAGRTDNDRFMFILPETQQDAALQLAEKISQQLLGISAGSDKQTVNMNIFYGVTSWNKGDDMEKLMKRVETQVEAAKKEASCTTAD